MIVIPVAPTLLLIMLVAGLASALTGWLIHRFTGKRRADNLMWLGIAIAALCGLGLVVGELTGQP